MTISYPRCVFKSSRTASYLLDCAQFTNGCIRSAVIISLRKALFRIADLAGRDTLVALLFRLENCW